MIDTKISQGFQTLDDVFAAIGAVSGESSQTPHTSQTHNTDPDRMKPISSFQSEEAANYDPPTPPDFP